MSMGIKQCCATGALHTGTPTGRITKAHGLDCYIADAPNGSPKGIVVIIPDIFGWKFPNNRILADCLAEQGNFQVWLPEFMDGVVVPESILISLKAMSATGIWNQLAKFGHAMTLAYYLIPFFYYNKFSISQPRVFNFLKALRKNEAKDLPLGTAGYCWGGNFVTRSCWDQADTNRTDDGKRVVDCGFAAHPSMLSYPADIDMIVLPYSCAAAELDEQMSPENAKVTEQALKAKTAKVKDQGVEHEFVMYEGAHHGFAVRADEGDEHEAAAGKKAEKQAVDWFSKWFANPPP